MAATRWAAARGKLIVSCQASAGDAFYASGEMARFARAAEAGGAGAIRCHGPADVAGIRAAVALPVLAIHKEIVDDGAILITPSFELAQALAQAGADAIALDCTRRGIERGALEQELARRVLVYPLRRLSIRLSSAGQYAGVRGAADDPRGGMMKPARGGTSPKADRAV